MCRKEHSVWIPGPKSAISHPCTLKQLLALLSLSQVEPIALLSNAPDTGFIGVFMYCDDQAAIKKLPINQRATAIAAAAGQHLQVSRT